MGVMVDTTTPTRLPWSRVIRMACIRARMMLRAGRITIHNVLTSIATDTATMAVTDGTATRISFSRPIARVFCADTTKATRVTAGTIVVTTDVTVAGPSS